MDYEEYVRKRRSENREFLKELGLLTTFKDDQPSRHNMIDNASRRVSKPRSKIKQEIPKVYLNPTRRSLRIRNIEPEKFKKAIDQITSEDFTEYQKKKETVKRENIFGAIPGIDVGTEFSTRLEASAAGIHRPTVAGIHGNPSLGCYSLALSGGYEDDVDLGYSFIYTGEGGRDLKGTKANPKNLRTAPQSKDQVLERGNLALSKNIQNNLPVRVLRGYKLRSQFAPLEGYRYDGLYNVVEYYTAKGLSGFNVYKFRLERVKNQQPAPWLDDVSNDENEENVTLPSKETTPEKKD